MTTIRTYFSTQSLRELDPTCFLGFTIDADQFEGNDLESCYREMTDPVIRNLCKELRPGTIRIGGSGIDHLYFAEQGESLPEGFEFAMDKRKCDALGDFCASTGASLMLSFPVRHGDIDNAIRFADYFVHERRDAVPFLEFANEPDWGWKGDMERYPELVERFYKAMAPQYPGKKWIAGYGGRSFPFGVCYPDSSEYLRFIERCGAYIDVFSVHYYVDSSNARTSSLPLMLQESAADIDWARMKELRMLLDATGLRDKRIAINEFNTFASQGLEGASNTMVAAVWIADFIGNLARSGAYANNIQCGFGRQHCHMKFWRYAMIDTRGEHPFVNPHYYAFYLWSRLMGSSVLPVMTASQTSPVLVHATADPVGGGVQLMLINKDLESAHDVELRCVDSSLAASFERYELCGAHPISRHASVNGVTVAEDGTMPPLEPTFESVQDDTLRVCVKPGSVVVLREV